MNRETMDAACDSRQDNAAIRVMNQYIAICGRESTCVCETEEGARDEALNRWGVNPFEICVCIPVQALRYDPSYKFENRE